MIFIPDLNGVHKEQKPCVVIDCNKNGIGVLKSGQMFSYHSFERKLVKWCKKLYLFILFDIAIVDTPIYITRHSDITHS